MKGVCEINSSNTAVIIETLAEFYLEKGSAQLRCCKSFLFFTRFDFSSTGIASNKNTFLKKKNER